MEQLRGKKALVTGAASGLGRAVALALSREGVDVWMLDIDLARLTLVVSEATTHGIEAIARHCDVTKPAAITHAIEEMLSQWGHLDILINNAGVAYYGPTEKMTAEQWDWLMAINLM